ncbi:hypothetical protein SDC9_186071 [bioreactor metagenome]|uniref:Uncharacterized protein n=1 Tax=bioreactor metagenome TaxID=1076179 RepID=A0A645HHW1_9ZZZZ
MAHRPGTDRECGDAVLAAAQTMRTTANCAYLLAETLSIAFIGIHNAKFGAQHANFIVHGVYYALQTRFKSGFHNLPVF